MSVHFLPNADQPPFPRSGPGRKPKAITSMAAFRRSRLDAQLRRPSFASDDLNRAFLRLSREIDPLAAERILRCLAERLSLMGCPV